MIRESSDLVPLWPHCEAPLDEILARAVDVGRGGGWTDPVRQAVCLRLSPL